MADGTFTTITSEGGLLPPDLLRRVTEGDRDVPGLTPGDYHLAGGERLRERISRSWNRLRGVWTSFREERGRLPGHDRGTTLTRERWLLPLFEELGYGRLRTAGSIEIEGTTYPVSHRWGPAPIHLLSFRYDLDRSTAGVAGAARWSPHSMVQELLNRTDEHLWAHLSNGRRLRVLRDSAALARQAYLEFDLDSMFDGEVYSDFVALWLTCHQSRVEADRPELCWLERWVEEAEEAGTRALDDLRTGVEKALRQLGTGFLSHPANAELRDAFSHRELTAQDYYRELLRVVYRLLFLFVAEDRETEGREIEDREIEGRELLLDAHAKPDVCDRYREHYSTQRLRRLARSVRGTRHDDLWRTHQLVVGGLGSDQGIPELALPPLGGQLFSPEATEHLTGARLRNDHFLEAIRHLAWMEQDKVVRKVDYRNLGADELGSVYESLLELHPAVSGDHRRFELQVAPGSERKQTGSYYTPSSLISQLLDTALDPVIDRAASQDDPQEALLSLTVVDPACGSGHFLVAAARRIARRVASIRTGDGEPAPSAIKEAMREVVPRCIHGVDINPMALELAKVSLWLEAHVPGKPLSFLDHHLRVGNSLLGATPALIARGIPDGAFKTIEGDDKTAVKEQRKRNRELRKQMERGVRQRTLYDLAAEERGVYDTLQDKARELHDLPDDDVGALHAKQEAHAALEDSPERRAATRLADAWCAAFTAPKLEGRESEEPFEVFYRMRSEPDTALRPAEVVDAQAEEYSFFHWHLEFPHVFDPDPDPDDEEDRTGWDGGFDAVVGNPPWISHAGRAAQPIPSRVRQFFKISYQAFGGYPTTHGMFVALAARILCLDGRLGLVLPTSVSDLDGYEPTRVEHDTYCQVIEPIHDFGDDAFEYVYQPCMALVSKRTHEGRKSNNAGSRWRLQRPNFTTRERDLLDHLMSRVPLPSRLFSERGWQTDGQKKETIVHLDGGLKRGYIGIREGKDIGEFRADNPRLQAPKEVIGSRLAAQCSTPILIRQTARFPIAAPNDGLAFRNSILAGDTSSEWDIDLLLGLLNSTLIRWFHYQNFRDARQGMPQVKIGHLRSIPQPRHLDEQTIDCLRAIVRNQRFSKDPLSSIEDREKLDQLVFDLYELTEEERNIVRKWWMKL